MGQSYVVWRILPGSGDSAEGWWPGHRLLDELRSGMPDRRVRLLALQWSIGVVAVTVPSSSSGAGGVPCAVGRRWSIAWRRHGGRVECRVLVLHGLWSASSGLGIWAEDSERAVRSPSQALRSARPHPFAAPAGAVAGIHPGKAARTVLLLPSVRSAPLDSPELLRVTPRPAPRTGVALLP